MSEPAEICLTTAALQQDLNQLLDFTLNRLKLRDKYTCNVIGQTDCSPLRTKNWGGGEKIGGQKSIYSLNVSSSARKQGGERQWFLLLWQPQQTTSGTEQEGGEKKKMKKKSSLVQVQCSKTQLGAPSSVCGVNSRAQGPGDKNKRRNKWKIPKNETGKLDGSCEKRPPRPPLPPCRRWRLIRGELRLLLPLVNRPPDGAHLHTQTPARCERVVLHFVPELLSHSCVPSWNKETETFFICVDLVTIEVSFRNMHLLAFLAPWDRITIPVFRLDTLSRKKTKQTNVQYY